MRKIYKRRDIYADVLWKKLRIFVSIIQQSTTLFFLLFCSLQDLRMIKIIREKISKKTRIYLIFLFCVHNGFVSNRSAMTNHGKIQCKEQDQLRQSLIENYIAVVIQLMLMTWSVYPVIIVAMTHRYQTCGISYYTNKILRVYCVILKKNNQLCIWRVKSLQPFS